MTTLVLGGTGFIGRRLVALLARRGEQVVCMDLNPQAAAGVFDEFGDQIKVVRGDVTQFDDVMSATLTAQPTRVVNLAFAMGSDFPPRVALKLNVIGMDNCFESARLAGVKRVVFASSLAVSGPQVGYGERVVTEDDLCLGRDQYGTHKIFNEWQAQDYREKYGMEITAVRPANVAGADKVVGSVDHVQCVTLPAAGESVTFPYRDIMRCPVHVDDMAEIFARIAMTDSPRYAIYNSGGSPLSMGELAKLVREFIPEADIRFDNEVGGKDQSYTYLIDNSRIEREFGFTLPPYRDRVHQMINEVRERSGLSVVPVG